MRLFVSTNGGACHREICGLTKAPAKKFFKAKPY
jgi:hypothetical protein